MLARAFRRFGPIAFQILNPTKRTIISVSRASVSSPTNVFTPRWYSLQANTEEMPVVDYEYVKKVALSKDSAIMIIDVREPDEIKEHGKIPNSINIPLGTIPTTLDVSEKEFEQAFKRAKPSKNTEIIFYCMIGSAKNYLGSWTDWATKTQ